MKVLISAYACEPNKGSEPGVGWNWAKQIAWFAETHVITRANNRNAIEEELRKSPIPNLYFHYYDLPKWVSIWKKRRQCFRFYYFLWQIGIYFIAKRLNREKRFDLVHHLTFGNIFYPTFLFLLPPPFIWGPLGGGETIPKAFRKDFDFLSKLKEVIRDVMLLTLKINPLFLFNCRKVKIIIIKTKDTANKIPFSLKDKVITVRDVASSLKPNTKEKYGTTNDIQVLAVGSLESWRGFNLLLNAFAKIVQKSANVKLVIIGDGIGREQLNKICMENHLEDHVVMKGALSQESYLECLSQSSILVNPCLREGGATVILDALSIGLAVICMDIAGTSEVVDDQCGIKIKLLNPEQTINDLAAAILKLANDPELRKKMGETGRKKVFELYTWDKKAVLIRKVYEKAAGVELLHDTRQLSTVDSEGKRRN